MSPYPKDTHVKVKDFDSLDTHDNVYFNVLNTYNHHYRLKVDKSLRYKSLKIGHTEVEAQNELDDEDDEYIYNLYSKLIDQKENVKKRKSILDIIKKNNKNKRLVIKTQSKHNYFESNLGVSGDKNICKVHKDKEKEKDNNIHHKIVDSINTIDKSVGIINEITTNDSTLYNKTVFNPKSSEKSKNKNDEFIELYKYVENLIENNKSNKFKSNFNSDQTNMKKITKTINQSIDNIRMPLNINTMLKNKNKNKNKNETYIEIDSNQDKYKHNSQNQLNYNTSTRMKNRTLINPNNNPIYLSEENQLINSDKMKKYTPKHYVNKNKQTVKQFFTNYTNNEIDINKMRNNFSFFKDQDYYNSIARPRVGDRVFENIYSHRDKHKVNNTLKNREYSTMKSNLDIEELKESQYQYRQYNQDDLQMDHLMKEYDEYYDEQLQQYYLYQNCYNNTYESRFRRTDADSIKDSNFNSSVNGLNLQRIENRLNNIKKKELKIKLMEKCINNSYDQI